LTKGSVADIRYTGWLVDVGKRTVGNEFDSNENKESAFSVEVGSGKVIAGWEEGLIGMGEGDERFLVVPPSMGYGENDVVERVPKNSTLAFMVRVVVVTGVAAISEPADASKATVDEADTATSKTRINRLMSKVGQSVMPMPRTKKNSESDAASTATDASTATEDEEATVTNPVVFRQHRQQQQPPQHQQSVPHHATSSLSVSDLVLAESRLQNTEMRMSMMRLDDKLERLTAMLKSSKVTQEPVELTITMEENEALKTEKDKLGVDLSKISSENDALKMENALLQSRVSDSMTTVEAKETTINRFRIDQAMERDDATRKSEKVVAKKVKKVLGRVYKKLQADFDDEESFSGEQVKQRLATTIRDLVEQLEQKAEVSEVGSSEVSETPVALVNPISAESCSESNA
jgi:hypothetical protein